MNNRTVKDYLSISNEDIKNDVITLTLESGEQIKVTYDYKNSPVSVKQKLMRNVYLSEDEVHLYQQMFFEVPVPTAFINAILIQYVLSDTALDYRQINSNVFPLKKSKRSMHLREFVSCPGHSNLFFVIDLDTSTERLICAEVHPSEPIAYNMCVLQLHQVTEAHWEGKGICIKDILNASDEELDQHSLLLQSTEIDDYV